MRFLKLAVSEERRRFLTVFVACTLVYFAVVYMFLVPKPREQFLEFHILGETREAAHYYPNGSSTIRVGSTMRWYLVVTNFMDSVQYVTIKMKLGNLTSRQPCEVGAVPADLPLLVEFKRILLSGEVWEIPIVWEIVRISERGEAVFLTLRINNRTVEVPEVGARGGHGFRIVFELWTLDRGLGSHVFGWEAHGRRRAAWIQMWFNATR